MSVKQPRFRDFSGGTNTRDSASELNENEVPYALNVTVDERGQATKRLGYADRYGTQVGTGNVTNVFYWGSQDKVVKQIGTGIHVDGGASIVTLGSSARVGFAEFQGNLYFNHPADGLRFYNGTVVTAVASAPKGDALAVWQNKLWSNDSTAIQRLWFSNIGDGTTWGGTSWVDLREKDSAKIVALGGAAGMDISGRPGLLAFKADSGYRINDPATGAFTTIDAAIGCSSNIGLVNAYGRTYVTSTRGIYSTDGLEPLREESQLIENFFHKDIINQTRGDLFCAGRWQDRLYFSFPLTGNTYNSRAIELHPIQRWVMAHTNAASAYAATKNTTDLVFGSPTNAGRVYNHASGGSDAGMDIASSLQTRWVEPNGGNKVRVRRARFVGYGNINATLLKNFGTSGSGLTFPVNMIPTGAGDWDGFQWDDGTDWGPAASMTHADKWSLGVVRECSIRIDETSSLTSTREPVLGTASPFIGAWTLSSITLLAFDLGNY